MNTYYTVINEDCKTCGHKHRRYNRAIDCYDNFIDFTPCDREPEIIQLNNNISLESAGFLWGAWDKYGEEGEKLQEFADKWTKRKIE